MAEEDANKDAGGGGWAGFLTELTKSFLILRDVFGYALPGAVFFSIGLLHQNHTLLVVKSRIDHYELPLWLQLFGGLGACYIAGHVMAAIAYLPMNHWGLPGVIPDVLRFFWRLPGNIVRGMLRALKAIKSFFAEQDTAPHEPKVAEPETEIKPKPPAPPTEPSTDAQLVAIRATHPELLTEYERQSTMTLLRGSTGMAMVLAFGIFYQFHGSAAAWMVGAAGAFLLFTFWFASLPHMRQLGDDTIAAEKIAEESEKGGPTTVEVDKLKDILDVLVAAMKTARDKLG